MGGTAAIALAGVAVVQSFMGANSAAHAATNAHTAQSEAAAESTQQINAAAQAKTDSQNKAAQNTQSAQARVRAISNPGGDSIMTSPLGASGGSSNVAGTGNPIASSTQPAAAEGKSILGG